MMFGRLFGVLEFEPVIVAAASHQDRDIALVLDVSGSMRRFGRFDALKNAVNVFLSELDRLPQREMVSLQVYSTRARKLVAMTDNLRQISNEFNKERAGGFTAIGDGLDIGNRSFNDPQARTGAIKQVILMTDGNHNTGVNPVVIARDSKAAGIIVNTITFSRGANQALMKQVARETGGIHLHANNNAQLIQAFRDLANEIPVLLIE